MQAVTDEQLIHWVADGDTSCLATLFERHHRGIFRYCLQLTGDRTQSEDLVQDIFLTVLKKAKSFRGDGSLKAWLYNIARNAAFDQLRKTKRRGKESSDAAALEQNHADHRSPELAAAANQKMHNVMQALESLPAAAREIIWLGRFEFDGYEGLGQALGCSAGTARVRMHRAMALLNSTYTNTYGDLDDA